VTGPQVGQPQGVGLGTTTPVQAMAGHMMSQITVPLVSLLPPSTDAQVGQPHGVGLGW